MKQFYLAATIAGAVVPYLFFIGFFADEGFALTTFIEALFENGAVSGFTVDLLISSGVLWAFMFTREDGPNPWPVVAVNLCIGLSCAFPLYLYLAERQRSAESASGVAA